jgi:hypothetical protein
MFIFDLRNRPNENPGKAGDDGLLRWVGQNNEMASGELRGVMIGG